MATSRHTIVYAEDDVDDLFIVKQGFQKHNHIDVVHAPDGRRALVILEDMAKENFLPCLVILDINMPVMNGRETLHAIRNHSQLNRLPVVLFSTSNNPADNAFAQSFDSELITKPIDFSDLEMIVDLFVNRCNFEINKTSTGSPYFKNS